MHYKILEFCKRSKNFMTFEKWWIGTFCRMSKNKILFSGTIHTKNHETLEHIEYSIQTKDLSANPEIGKISTSSSEAALLIESQWDDITYRVLLMVFCPLMSPERSRKRKVIKMHSCQPKKPHETYVFSKLSFSCMWIHTVETIWWQLLYVLLQ